MKKNLKYIVSFVVFALILIWIIWFVNKSWHDFSALRISSYPAFVLLIFFTFLFFLVQGLILKIVLAQYKIYLRFNEWFGLTILTLMGNYIIPFGGLGYRATYLKTKYQFIYSNFVSTLGAIWLVEFVVFTIGGLLGLVYSKLYYNLTDFKLFWFFGIVLLFCLIILILNPKISSKNKFLDALSQVLECWNNLKQNKVLFKKLFLITIFEYLLLFLTFVFSFQSFGFKMPLVGSFIASSLSDYSTFVRIIPASLGLYEGTVVYVTHIFDMPVFNGLAISAILRFAGLVWIVSLGIYFSYSLAIKKMIDKVQK